MVLKVSRRVTWILVILFCVVVWSIVVAIAFAGNNERVAPKIQPGESSHQVDIKKIQKLNLNPQQKKFIESLIESPSTKLNGN